MKNETDFKLGRRSFVLSLVPAFFHRDIFRRPANEELCGIEFQVVRYAWRSPRRYLLIHGDEDTARQILSAYMNDHDGIAYLVTGKDRDVTIDGAKIDPNRMFSRVGAEKSIRELNPNLDPLKIDAALDFLDHERERLVRRLTPEKGSRLVALHNNRDYSVNNEIAASDQTSLKQPTQPGNFFLCTDAHDYDILKQSPFNVVLQSKPDPDDGSLSRLAAKRGFRYINLECSIGSYEDQMQMLRWLDDRLP
jgi:hypothetical protein